MECSRKLYLFRAGYEAVPSLGAWIKAKACFASPGFGKLSFG